jgi:hypothetical protein
MLNDLQWAEGTHGMFIRDPGTIFYEEAASISMQVHSQHPSELGKIVNIDTTSVNPEAPAVAAA